MNLQKKTIATWLLVIVILLYFTRIIYLDSDLHAPWGVLMYQPIDEGTYANLALNKINFGAINPNDVLPSNLSVLMQPHVIMNVVGNFFTYLTLSIFGDNFYGFKMGSVVVGFIIVLLFYKTLKDLNRKYGTSTNNDLCILVFMSILVFSFTFYNASRLVEPTLYRLLFAQIVMYIMMREEWNFKVKYFLLCFFITISIFLVYITNSYLALSVIFLFLYFMFSKNKEQSKALLKYGSIGVISAYLISLIYYQVFWETGPFINMIEGMNSFQYSQYYEISSSTFLSNIFSFFSNNIFLYAIPIVMFCILYFYDFIKYAFKKKDIIILYLIFQVFALLIQTIVSYDFITRKAIVIFPTILYIAFITYNLLIGGEISAHKKRFSLISAVLFPVFIFVYRMYLVTDKTNLDFSQKDKLILLICCTLSIVLIFLIYKNPTKCNLKKLLFAGGIIVISTNGMFILKYNILHPTYETKKMMIDIGTLANDKFVLGEYQNGFTLYNSIKPVLNTQEKLNEYMKSGENYLYLDFSDYSTFNTEPDSLNQNVEIIETYLHYFQANGQFRSLSLFKYKK